MTIRKLVIIMKGKNFESEYNLHFNNYTTIQFVVKKVINLGNVFHIERLWGDLEKKVRGI